MGTELVRRGNGNGVLPAVCSAIIPGVGQLVNGETDKAIGVFVVHAAAAASFIASVPLIGPIAAVVAAGTWIYGVADGYIQGKKKG
jgi:hypothetical protein